MARSLNRVQLIGNLTRDPELRYTPSGSAVCTFGIATNRTWTTDSGEKREEVDFHNIVAWRKLAELCSQFLTKGRKVYVEGRLSTRSWTGQDGQQKSLSKLSEALLSQTAFIMMLLYPTTQTLLDGFTYCLLLLCSYVSYAISPAADCDVGGPDRTEL